MNYPSKVEPRYRLTIGTKFHFCRLVDLKTGEDIPAWAFSVDGDGMDPAEVRVSITFPPGWVAIEGEKA